MDWRSNFSEEELELIDGVVTFAQQIGYEEGSLQEIIKRMVSILDNAEEIINRRDSLLQTAVKVVDFNLDKPTKYKGPPCIKLD